MTDKQNRIDAVTNWLDEKYPGHSVERPTEGLPRNSVEAWQIMGESGIHAVRVSLLGIQEDTGTIEVGKQADLVLIDGDPHSDPGALRNVWAVFQGGRRIR